MAQEQWYGERHHKTRYSDEEVELCRELYEAGMPPKVIAWKLELPLNTVYDWVYCRTRTGTETYRTARKRAAACGA